MAKRNPLFNPPERFSDKVVLRIMWLCLQINRNTDYTVHCEFHGHTDQLDVAVMRPGEDWGTATISESIYLDRELHHLEPDRRMKDLLAALSQMNEGEKMPTLSTIQST